MYITSAARLRFDIPYYINKLRNEQNRRLHNSSWLMTLPLWCELHWLPHATSPEMRYTFKQGIILQDDHFVLHHHMPFRQMLSTQYIYCLQNLNTSLILPPLDFYRIFTTTTMETADYWLMAWEYSIWNADIASLQFWTEDLIPVTLGIDSEHVYTTFFYTSTSQTLHWWNIVWTFCHSPECSLHTTTIASSCWSWYNQFTNPITKDSLHTPCFQHGTCFLQPSDHYTLQYSNNHTLQYNTNSS